MMKQNFILILCGLTALLNAQVEVVAHRGASHLAPENTIASVQLAYQLNADAVEVDVYLSADEELMVIHDKDTYRTSGGKRDLKVAESHSVDLNQIDVGAWKDPKYKGEMLPYLRDILDLVPEDKRLVIEIKCGPEIIPALQTVVAESGKLSQCDFICFSFETICLVHSAFPDNPCFYLKMYPWCIKKQMRAVADAGLDGINLYYKIVNKRHMAYAQSLGLAVWCWTVDKPKDFDKMKKLGIGAITTNKPSLYTANKYRLPEAL